MADIEATTGEMVDHVFFSIRGLEQVQDIAQLMNKAKEFLSRDHQ